MVILGIDPGIASTGFGAISCGKSSPSVVKCGCISTSAKDHVANRLFQIYSDLNRLSRTLRPDLVAVENVFSVVRYPRAGILLGGVLGIIYLSVFESGIRMVEMTPKEVKNALVGWGGADKKQVRAAVKVALEIPGLKSFHASDALGVALAAYYRNSGGRRR